MGPLADQTNSTAGQIRLRYWASARAAAGVEEDVIHAVGPVSLEALRTQARALHSAEPRFSAVLDTCSILVGDRPVASADPASVQVNPGQTVEFLPPFAGG